MLRYFIKYLANLSVGRRVLWSYIIWYLFFMTRYFESTPALWFTAMGLSALIGVAIWINAAASGSTPIKLERWPIARFFMFPFCVSSFSATVKGHHFFLVFSRNPYEDLAALCACALPWVACAVARSFGTESEELFGASEAPASEGAS